MSYSNDVIHTVEKLNHKYNKKTNFLYLFVIVVLISTFCALPYIFIEITSQARGVLRSKIEDVNLVSITQGKVCFVHLKNNLTVVKGQKLIEIEPAVLESQEKTKEMLLVELELQLQDLQQLCHEKYSFEVLQTPVYQKELSVYLQNVSQARIKFKQAKNEFTRTKSAFIEGVASKQEYDRALFDYNIADTALKTIKAEQKSTWQTKNRQVEVEINNLKGNIDQITEEKKNYIITAPISGTIVNYTGIQQGSFINGGQKIADISPDNYLIVESMVSPSDIGFIKKGQVVKLQVDAFNYNQWGLAKAKVIEVEKNLTITEKQMFFKVRCKLLTPSLKLKNGYTVKLKKGMTLTARFSLVERSLWNLLFDKVDDWFNPKIKNIE